MVIIVAAAAVMDVGARSVGSVELVECELEDTSVGLAELDVGAGNEDVEEGLEGGEDLGGLCCGGSAVVPAVAVASSI